jgi:hypothetical protein
MRSAKTLQQRIEQKSEQLAKRYKKMSPKEFWRKMDVLALRTALLGFEDEINKLSNDKG